MSDRAALRKAARARKRYERKEVKRFTRRSRNRRVAWLSVVGILVTLILLVTAAVFSPVLSLKTITVEGASRVSATDIQSAVKDQLGTPLALLDSAKIKQELARFPLIRSYVTEAVPPNTLVIHIVERAPVASIASGSGFTVVDPAGITISKSADRPPSLPLIDVGDSGTKGAAFTAAVQVLLVLPQSVLAQVDTVTAHTTDDVAFSLTGVGQTVVWGSAERSDQKDRVLAGLIKNQDPHKPVQFDVSAPGAPVVRPS
jgi:cell division protein FtsQ